MPDFSHKAHENFHNYYLFFQHIDVKSTSISCKIEVHVESNFYLSVSIDVFYHYNATHIKNKIILGL